MKKMNWIAVLCALALALTLAGCGGGEETTVSGMVVSLDGTTVTLMEMSGSMGDFSSMFENGEMPQRPQSGEEGSRPDGMEDFTLPEDFDFDNFDPENMPEGFDRENFDPDNMPERGQMPEGFDPGSFGGMPQNGERPEMPEGGGFSGFGEQPPMGETTAVDIANARIGVEIENGKESGSLANVTPGAMVTITLSSKGEATYVLVSSSGMSFGGSFMPRT